MYLKHRALAWSYPAFALAKAVAGPLGFGTSDALRVLVYHHIAPEQQAHFAMQLRWLTRRWRFVSPARFVAMVNREEPIQGANLLMTFDDGFASHRVVAEDVLRPLGIQALFFVVSDFVNITEPLQARRFIAERILPGTRIEDVPVDCRNMKWTDLEALLEQGHAIGGHTRTHARLSAIDNRSELEDEIIGSGDLLSERLGTPIEHFAYTFGDLSSLTPKALQVARQRFRWVHSVLRGDNALDTPPYAIARDGFYATDSPNLLGFFLSGGGDFHYKRERASLIEWGVDVPVEH